MDIDLKWIEVRQFYENTYKNRDGLPILFKKRPTNLMIEMLYASMKKLGRELGEFYANDIGLSHRLDHIQGLQSKKEDPTEKRGPWD